MFNYDFEDRPYWNGEYEEYPEVWDGLLSNFFIDSDLAKLQNCVDDWNKICDERDKLIIKPNAYDIKGRLLTGQVALHRKYIKHYSNLSKFWNMYRKEVNE